MDIKYFIEPIFKIEGFKIKCANFKKKKKEMEKALKKIPETRNKHFDSSRRADDNSLTIQSDLRVPLKNIFAEEFNVMKTQYSANLDLTAAWSVTYKKGDYHLPHNHGSVGYGGVLYLDMQPKHPHTIYLQPWNNDRDNSVLFRPPAEEGDIMIIPKFIIHHSEPNKLNAPKRIIGFDFNLI